MDNPFIFQIVKLKGYLRIDIFHGSAAIESQSNMLAAYNFHENTGALIFWKALKVKANNWSFIQKVKFQKLKHNISVTVVLKSTTTANKKNVLKPQFRSANTNKVDSSNIPSRFDSIESDRRIRNPISFREWMANIHPACKPVSGVRVWLSPRGPSKSWCGFHLLGCSKRLVVGL